MKSISASIVIAAGMGAVVASGFVVDHHIHTMIGFVGGVVLILGFVGWMRTLADRSEK